MVTRIMRPPVATKSPRQTKPALPNAANNRDLRDARPHGATVCRAPNEASFAEPDDCPRRPGHEAVPGARAPRRTGPGPLRGKEQCLQEFSAFPYSQANQVDP